MNWDKIEKIYTELASTHYPQPEEPVGMGHSLAAQNAVDWLMKRIAVSSCVDMGCGEGFMQPMFEKHGVSYTGLAFGQDVINAQAKGRNVIECDFNLPPAGLSAELLTSRHSLEHSLFPHITLNIWREVATKYIFLVLPAYEWVFSGIKGSNHFNVLTLDQWKACFTHADLEIKDWLVTWRQGRPDIHAPNERTQDEYWFLLQQRRDDGT